MSDSEESALEPAADGIWRPPSLPPSVRKLIPGRSLGRYELLCPIAQGGMATVWVARLRGAHGFEKLVAVKTMLSELATEQHYQKMMLDEARIVSRIRHQNVAEIFDLGGEDALMYLVMEWVEGDSLSVLHRALHVRGQLLPPTIALRIAAHTCAGLHAAHELKSREGKPLHVVHRDVSPQNVLISVEGEVKLIDFGIAKATHRESPDTRTGIVRGKVAFMAPEQALGQRVDRRADVWSTGVVLYHLLSGNLPYRESNDLATLHAISSGKAAPPIPGLAAPIAELLRRVLEPDRDRRIATAEELESELERLIAKLGPVTARDVASYVNQYLSRRVAAKRATVETALRAAEQRADLLDKFESAIADARAGVLDGVVDGSSPLVLHGPANARRSEAPPAEIASLLEVTAPKLRRFPKLKHWMALVALSAFGLGAFSVVRAVETPHPTLTPSPAAQRAREPSVTESAKLPSTPTLELSSPAPPAPEESPASKLEAGPSPAATARAALGRRPASRPKRNEAPKAREDDVFNAFSNRQ